MNREARIRGVVLPPPLIGLMASAATGAGVGFVLWTVGMRRSTYLIDLLTCGALFGLVAGSLGLTAGNLSRRVLRGPATLTKGGDLIVGAFFGAIPGVIFRWGLHPEIMEAVFFGACGAIGAMIAVVFERRSLERIP